MNKKMFMEERRNQILNSINNSGRVDVLEIASEFNVSTATIRSDLNYLTNIGKINRTHGGAITKKLTSIVEEEIPVIEKENICIEEKIKIAKAALELIEDKQNIFLDTSSTVYQLAKLLHSKRELKMITNSVRIVQEISCGTDKELILIGGIFRKNSYATSGPSAMKMLDEFYVHTFFLGVSGIDLQNGVTVANIYEAEIKKKMVEKAQTVVVLADSSKFGKIGFINVAPLTNIDIIITNEISEDYKNVLSRLGVKLIIV